jgi:hypothetical protein
VLVAGAAPVGDALDAQESAPVASPARTAPGELAIWLAVALAVQDVGAQMLKGRAGSPLPAAACQRTRSDSPRRRARSNAPYQRPT